MGKRNFLLAQKCVNTRTEDSRLVTVADVLSAFEAVIKSEPPPYADWRRSMIRNLHASALVICEYVGERKDSRETKTAETTLVSEIIGIKDDLGKHLKHKVEKGELTRHFIHLHLIITSARA